MRALLAAADGILRGQSVGEAPNARRSAWIGAMSCVVVYGCLYGALMGTFNGLMPGRGMQIVYSAIKVPFLLLTTFVLSLPSFCVINTLAGLRADLRATVSAIIAAQAAITITLASLAPVTLLWYVSSSHYEAAILFNGLVFTAAAVGGQVCLRRRYSTLVARDSRHRHMLRLWLVTYAFVGIQMGWVLRPFIGAPQFAPTFFREGAWDNAYEIVARMVWRVLMQSSGG